MELYERRRDNNIFRADAIRGMLLGEEACPGFLQGNNKKEIREKVLNEILYYNLWSKKEILEDHSEGRVNCCGCKILWRILSSGDQKVFEITLIE